MTGWHDCDFVFFSSVIIAAQLMLFLTNYVLRTLNHSGFATIKSQHRNTQWHTVYNLMPDIYGLDWIECKLWTSRLDWIGSGKMEPRPTLRQLADLRQKLVQQMQRVLIDRLKMTVRKQMVIRFKVKEVAHQIAHRLAQLQGTAIARLTSDAQPVHENARDSPHYWSGLNVFKRITAERKTTGRKILANIETVMLLFSDYYVDWIREQVTWRSKFSSFQNISFCQHHHCNDHDNDNNQLLNSHARHNSTI